MFRNTFLQRLEGELFSFFITFNTATQIIYEAVYSRRIFSLALGNSSLTLQLSVNFRKIFASWFGAVVQFTKTNAGDFWSSYLASNNVYCVHNQSMWQHCYLALFFTSLFAVQNICWYAANEGIRCKVLHKSKFLCWDNSRWYQYILWNMLVWLFWNRVQLRV